VAPESEPTVTEDMIEQLAKLAELELDAERRTLIAEQLDPLLTDANAVNRFMAGRREVSPGIRFHHPEPERDQ
jgi:Asp-tRNA(Asn)/Glu-tRNA(Gln) amidotransferase C subunit